MMLSLALLLALAAPSRAAAVEGSSEPAKAATPAVSAEMRKTVLRLMELTDSIKIADQMQEALLGQFREALSAKASDKERYEDIIGAIDRGLKKHLSKEALEELTVEIYARHATVSDLKALIKFYETAAGQRVIKALPVIMKESVEAGMRLGNAATLDVLKELAPKYPECAELLPESERPAPAAEPEPKKP